MFDGNKIPNKKNSSRGEGGLLNVYVVFRGGLPNVYVYLQGGRGGQKWPKSCLRSKSMTPKSKFIISPEHHGAFIVPRVTPEP